MKEKIKQINELLLEKKAQMIQKNALLPPHDYASFRALAINQELEEECKALSDLVESSDSVGVFRAAFKTHCQERAEANADTCLSLMAMPSGECNRLYWQIMEILFQPKTLGEALSILLPDVTTVISCQVEVPLAANKPHFKIDNAQIILTEGSTTSLQQAPPSLEDLSCLVVSDNAVFDVRDIQNFSLELHEKFYNAIQKKYGVTDQKQDLEAPQEQEKPEESQKSLKYPGLITKLYQHNPALKELSSHLMMLAKNGVTPYDVISKLIQDFRLGGETLTGKLHATVEAEIAQQTFTRYLTSLPSAMENALLQLKSSGKHANFSLQDVLKSLEAGGCVETASDVLGGILNNSQNKVILTTRPNLSRQEVEKLKKQYKTKGKPALSPGNDPTISLPERYIKANFEKIQLNNANDYLTFLLAFPPVGYNDFFSYVKINCRPFLPVALGQMLSGNLFNEEQGQAINHAIAQNVDKLGGLREITLFAVAHNNTQLLQELLTNRPREQCLALIKMIKAHAKLGNTALHLAAKNPVLLKTILELFPETECLKAVTKTNSNGNTVLHLAANNPDSLGIILKLFPTKAKCLQAVGKKNRNDNTVLHLAANNPDCLAIILELFPTEAKCLQAVKEKNINDNTALHLAANNPESLKTILELFPETKRLEAVRKKNYNDETLLHLAANNPQSLKIILDLFPETKRLEAVKEKNYKGATALHLAVNNPECLAMILRLYPATERLKALKEINDCCRKTTLNLAANNPESLKTILELLPKSECLSAVREKDENGAPILQRIANNLEYLKTILSLLSETELCAAVKEKNYKGDTTLHKVVKNPEYLETILTLLPKEKLLDAVMVRNRDGDTVLHRAAASAPESLQTILKLIPSAEAFLAAIKKETADKNPILYQAVNNPECLKIILELLPETDRLSEVMSKKDNGDTVLVQVARNPESLKIILESLPESERLKVVIGKNSHKNTLLHMAANNPESLKIILELLPQSERLAVLIEQNWDCNTAPHWAANNPQCLKIILESLSESERLKMVIVKNSYGNSVLHLAANNPESLKIISGLLPKAQHVEAVTGINLDGNAVLHLAANNPESLKIILKLFPESKRLRAVIKKNNYHSTTLDKVANNPESLKTVLKLLPESDSLKAVRASNFFNLSNLYATIGELKKHGQSLTEKDNSNPKGDLIITLADDLEKLTNRFCIAAIKQDETFSLQEFKQKFLGELSSKKAPLQKHSAQWKPIIANILLALTGVGVVAIAAKAVAATFVAGRSYYRSREKPMAKNFFFWGKTTSTKKLEETNEGLKLVYDKSPTLKFLR